MTRKEWMEIHYPKSVDNIYTGDVRYCPVDIRDAPDPTWSECSDELDCAECWGLTVLTNDSEDGYQTMNAEDVQMAINRLECGNTAHSRTASYIRLAIQALHKLLPEEPVKRATGRYHCKCNAVVHYGENFCNRCGQRIKWRNV